MLENSKLSKENLAKSGNELKNHVKAFDGKYYQYNLEQQGIYYCPDNLIVDTKENKIIKLPEYQILADYFVIDTKENKVTVYDKRCCDAFLNSVAKIENINVQNDNVIIVKKDDTIKEPANRVVRIKLNQGSIVALEDDSLTSCGEFYLAWCNALKSLSVANLKSCGAFFNEYNKVLETLNAPSLEQCGIRFLEENRVMKELKLPSLKKCGFDFMKFNNSLIKLDASQLEDIGAYFMSANECLQEFIAPNIKNISHNFMDKYQGPIKDDIAKRHKLSTYWERYMQEHQDKDNEDSTGYWWND